MPHQLVLIRIRAEYLEMPGLRLTMEQARRLWGVDSELCQLALDALVEERFLCVRADGTYVRATDGATRQRPQPAKAELTTPVVIVKAS